MYWGTRTDREWEENLREARAYYEKNGNLAIPRKYITESGVRLGYWISRIRQSANGDSNRMRLTPERIEQLDEIGMIWNHDDYLWERNYAAAKRYFIQYGDLNVPSRYIDEDGVRLYDWLNKVRTDYSNHNTDNLTVDRIDALNRIDMVWLTPLQKRWHDVYSALKEYYDAHGTVDVPYNYKPPDGVNVWCWLNNQKKKHTAGKLEEERIALLEDLNVCWDDSANLYTWEDMFCFAKQFYQENGHLVIPSNCKINGVWLARWGSYQRQRYLNKKQPPLSEEQIKNLKASEYFGEPFLSANGMNSSLKQKPILLNTATLIFLMIMFLQATGRQRTG